MLYHIGVAANLLHMCSVVYEQHAVVLVEGSLPPETDAVILWQLIDLCSFSFGAGRIIF